MVEISPGLLFIADPFLQDPNFQRSVIFLCEHQEEGSFGFVLNKLHDQTLGDLMEDIADCKLPVYYGGPVQIDTVHFLHHCPNLIHGGFEIIDGIYWGGDFEEVANLIKENLLNPNEIRFFIGYSGWGENQLENELKDKSWITIEGTKDLVFHKKTDFIWKEALKEKGGDYSMMINYPLDPSYN